MWHSHSLGIDQIQKKRQKTIQKQKKEKFFMYHLLKFDLYLQIKYTTNQLNTQSLQNGEL